MKGCLGMPEMNPVKKQDKLIGLCFHSDKLNELEEVRSIGFNALRLMVPFPWSDKMYGETTDRYKHCKELIRIAKSYGFSIMVNTPGLGAYSFNREKGKTLWHDEFPAFAGEKGTAAYYENVKKTCAWIAEDVRDYSGPLWCHMNEIDIKTFHGDYSLKVAAETAFQSAVGVISVDPKALCGINLSRYWEVAVETADMAYRDGHRFGYIGDDQYFGSWQGHDVERWWYVIEELHRRYKLPVVANEWGYSSGGVLSPKPESDENVPPGLNTVCDAFAWHHEVEGGHTPDVQAKYLRRGLQIFAENPYVLGSFLFCWKDAKYCYHCGRELCPSECFWGIVDYNGKPKPAYYAVKEAIQEFYK
jgi:hypothetical protein